LYIGKTNEKNENEIPKIETNQSKLKKIIVMKEKRASEHRCATHPSTRDKPTARATTAFAANTISLSADASLSQLSGWRYKERAERCAPRITAQRFCNR
jgi:hypothetical protein